MTLPSSLWAVDVAVPVPLRGFFTYLLPAEWSAGEKPQLGTRVLVPFRNRLQHAVVMCEPYPFPADQDARKYRNVISFDPNPVMAAEIHQLLLWMAKYYKAPPGELVKLVLPPGVLDQKEIVFKFTECGRREAILDPAFHLLNLLPESGLDQKAWELAAQTKIKQADIRRWEADGWLEITYSGSDREAIPHVPCVKLTPLGMGARPESLPRSPKQQECLLFLQQQGDGPVVISALSAQFSTSVISGLEEKGLLVRERVPKHEIESGLTEFEPDEIRTLTPEQSAALGCLEEGLSESRFLSYLMYGVTGAGKTEVYLRAIHSCLEQGRQALFLVPEIALTPLMHKRIRDRFGDRLAILHSAVGAAQRSEAWARVLAGKVDVVLGARSGVFAPLPRLGLVIVDEEHDQSYKQNDGIRYHARDVALVRAKMAGAVAVLGSATPSLESWRNYEQGRYRLLTLKNRATSAKLPTVEIVDMKEEFRRQKRKPIFSGSLLDGLEETLNRGRQAMVLLNRRGFHSFLLCRKCGESMTCESCEVTLTYHKKADRLRCHYCDASSVVPEACPHCQAPAAMMQFFGEGTEQIQGLLQELFPDYTVDRLDRDRLTRKDAHREILEKFEKKETHLLVGTQMIAKGHDFPNVTFVGILNADQGLRIPDFRCAETTFQLITQVAGRSGRGLDHGRVVIQTYMPEHYAVQAAASHNFEKFLQRELRYREAMFYSPFSVMVNILVTHKSEEKAASATEWMAQQLHHLADRKEIDVLGPTKAPIGKIKNAFRFQIVLKAANRAVLHQYADAVVEEAVRRDYLPRTSIILDIDPYQFL